MSYCKRTEYQSKPMLTITREENDDRYPFSFGFMKAKMILEHIDEIKKFVEEMESKGSGK
jgi:hypothetical protein